ncbi:MAG: RidA family protein [Proteobacteria bacterium]|nr:RidA family protein [Pseudomonadota bacterium]
MSLRSSRAGLAFISGQVALDRDRRLVGRGDVEAQAVQAFANLELALAGAGATLEDVLRLNTYVTNAAFVAPFRTVRDRILPTPQPASTLVVVAALADADWLIEIEAVAALG